MGEDNLKALFSVIPEGMFDSPEDLLELIKEEGVEALYPLIPEGMFESEEDFVATFQGEKKKRFFWRFSYPTYGISYVSTSRSGRERSFFFGLNYGFNRRSKPTRLTN